MGHSVGDAAANAVKKSEKRATEVQTPAQLIDALRKNYRANLYIPMHQIGALLTAYDAAVEESRMNGVAAGVANGALLQMEAEKKVMTDTIFGLTQKVQEFQNAVSKAESDLQAAI